MRASVLMLLLALSACATEGPGSPQTYRCEDAGGNLRSFRFGTEGYLGTAVLQDQRPDGTWSANRCHLLAGCVWDNDNFRAGDEEFSFTYRRGDGHTEFNLGLSNEFTGVCRPEQPLGG